MTETLRPDSVEQLADVLSWANSDLKPLELVGGGTKAGVGRPVQTAHTLDMSAFAGVTLYEPEELVLGAGPATPLEEIQTKLEANGQQMAFEPPDLSGLLGAASSGTIGGIIACNLAGPRRIKDGAARDHFLGFDGVSGRGQAVKSGGRVMKNVTGYDLPKLICGSYGTLVAMTALTVKVLPKPEKQRTVLVRGVDMAAAVKVLASGLNGPFEVSGAAWFPASVAERSDVSYIQSAGDTVAALRLEGFGPSVEYRCASLRKRLANFGETEELHTHNSTVFWREVRDVTAFSGDDRVVWRVSLAPTDAPLFLDRILPVIKGAEAYLDWAGGLVWLAVNAPKQGAHEPIREALAATPHGGHATLIRGPAVLRSAVPVFQPQPGATAALTMRIKDAFDPNRILNPGRMSEGV